MTFQLEFSRSSGQPEVSAFKLDGRPHGRGPYEFRQKLHIHFVDLGDESWALWILKKQFRVVRVLMAKVPGDEESPEFPLARRH